MGPERSEGWRSRLQARISSYQWSRSPFWQQHLASYLVSGLSDGAPPKTKLARTDRLSVQTCLSCPWLAPIWASAHQAPHTRLRTPVGIVKDSFDSRGSCWTFYPDTSVSTLSWPGTEDIKESCQSGQTP